MRLAVDHEGRLVCSGSARRTIRLRFDVGGASILHGDDEGPICLPWDSYGSLRWVMDGPPRDGWTVTHFTSGRHGVYGVAIQVSGALDDLCREASRATRTPWRRFNRWMEVGTLTGHALPIVPAATIFGSCGRERAALDALASAIAARWPLRARLADPGRMHRLASDLRRLPAPPVEKGTLRRDATDVQVAIRKAGLVHPYGRPLADSERVPVPEAVERTIAELQRNPFRAGRRTDTALVERLVRRDFCGVEAWPFDALID